MDDRRTRASSCDVAIVGAGAAGLATAIFARRRAPGRCGPAPRRRRDARREDPGQRRRRAATSPTPSSRERDFWGGRAAIVRRVLRAFPVSATVAFFARSRRARCTRKPAASSFPTATARATCSMALLRGVERRAARTLLSPAPRASTSRATMSGFVLDDLARRSRSARARGPRHRRSVAAEDRQRRRRLSHRAALGHTIVERRRRWRRSCSTTRRCDCTTAVAASRVDGELAIWIDGAVATSASRRAALDALRRQRSGGAERVAALGARADRGPRVSTSPLNFYPGRAFDDVDADWRRARRGTTSRGVQAALGRRCPTRSPPPLLDAPRDRRSARAGATSRATIAAASCTRSSIGRCRSPTRAATTTPRSPPGGVALSRDQPGDDGVARLPGLFLVGEILDVDGRIGGFNFQWAWATGKVAGSALARLRA